MAQIADFPYPLDLPIELREQILADCSRSALVALATTSKDVTSEAEAMLYEIVSLHDSREEELFACLKALTGSPRKAQLVRTFAVTFVQSREYTFRKRSRKHIEHLFDLLPLALRQMTGLKMLSVRLPEDVDLMVVETVLREKRFNLERLYVNSISDIGLLLECQPHLRILCWWSLIVQSVEVWHKRENAVASHRLEASTCAPSGTTQQGPRRANPIMFGAYYDEGERLDALAIYDYPLPLSGKDSNTIPNFSLDSERPAHCSPLFDIAGRNHQLRRRIREDMNVEIPPEVPGSLFFVIPELSPAHLSWALGVLPQLLACYPCEKPDIFLSVIISPKPSEDMAALYDSVVQSLTGRACRWRITKVHP